MPNYVKLFRSTWQDEDFLALPASAQRAYLMLMSQQDISHCGVLPLTPGRWGRLASDTDADSVRRDIHSLTVPRTLHSTLARTVPPFVLVDEQTEELLVRSYAKHDDGFRVPNGRIALARAIERVMSVPIRQAALTLAESLVATVGATLPLTLGPPQQPAASSHEPLPAASSQQPDPSTNGSLNPRPVPTQLPAAAAAAVDALIEYKVVADSPRRPDRYRSTLQRSLPAEHWPALSEYLTRHPTANALNLATQVLSMNERDALAHLEHSA